MENKERVALKKGRGVLSIGKKTLQKQTK